MLHIYRLFVHLSLASEVVCLSRVPPWCTMEVSFCFDTRSVTMANQLNLLTSVSWIRMGINNNICNTDMNFE